VRRLSSRRGPKIGSTTVGGSEQNTISAEKHKRRQRKRIQTSANSHRAPSVAAEVPPEREDSGRHPCKGRGIYSPHEGGDRVTVKGIQPQAAPLQGLTLDLWNTATATAVAFALAQREERNWQPSAFRVC